MRVWVAIILAFCGTGLHAADGRDSAALETGRRYTRWLYDGRTDLLWSRAAATMRAAFHDDQAKFSEAISRPIETWSGPETSLISDSVTRNGDAVYYSRLARFARRAGEYDLLVWGFKEDGQLLGLSFHAAERAADSPYLAYRTRTPLRLPFREPFHVLWGGRTIERNYHAAYRDQRFAYDFLVTRSGVSHRADGRSNSDYYAYGLPIVAPAAGVVVEAVDGVADNAPGEASFDQPFGNHVVIDHGDGEFSVLAHLKTGSVAVSVRDRVEAGDLLGLCGNSGHSTEPHLHYHLQNSATLQDADGLPAQFLDYTADGTTIPRGEPLQGQTVAPR